MATIEMHSTSAVRLPARFQGLLYTAQTNWPRFELTVRNWTNRSIESVPRNPLDPTTQIDQAITDFVGYPRLVLGCSIFNGTPKVRTSMRLLLALLFTACSVPAW